MDFEEFLWAKGNTVTMPAVKSAFESRKPLGDAVHRKIMQLFREYIAVGGMPQAVASYVNGTVMPLSIGLSRAFFRCMKMI